MLLLGGGLLGPAAAQAPDDEEFPVSDLLGGKRTSREECNATRDAVWVEHREGTECIRYFPSSNVVGAKQAVLFFPGDQLDGRFVIAGAYKDNRASVQRANAETLAKVNDVPYILVARPGTYGSSGRHAERRLPKEYLSLNAAVDVIKARYGFEQVLLGGQSGGAAAVGALLTLGRTDVACAVASSGVYDAVARAADLALRSGRQPNGCDVTGYCGSYNVTDHVDGVAKSEGRRIFIIGDPEDTNTAFKYQRAFAEKLMAAGHAVVLAEGEATGPQRHSLSHMANRTLGWCHAGYDDARIVALIRSNALALRTPKPKSPAARP
jgi:hypothetical protein